MRIEMPKAVLKMNLLIMCLLGLLCCSLRSEATEHQHQHETLAKPGLNQGEKWPADASLLKGMEEIREVLEKSDLIRDGKLSRKEGSVLSKKVSAALKGIFETCKLPPRADATLHALLMPIVEGGKKLGAAGEGERREGLHKILASLERYPDYFEHPGWKPFHEKTKH